MQFTVRKYRHKEACKPEEHHSLKLKEIKGKIKKDIEV